MSRSLRIDQALPSFGKYDAIGVEVLLIRAHLRQLGYASDIFYSESTASSEAKPFSHYADQFGQNSENLLIHHFSIGSHLTFAVDQVAAQKVTRFHNITPPDFFTLPEMIYTRSQCLKGISQLPILREHSIASWAASQFNADDLSGFGFPKSLLLPVLRDYKKLASLQPDPQLTADFAKIPKKTIIFVGRIVPHKAQHDLLFLLHCLKKQLNEPIRLILVGGYDPSYLRKILLPIANRLELSWLTQGSTPQLDGDVLHFSSISECKLATLYHCADMFISMSEHEGFCVPLVEAMHFGLPILAHDSSAVSETCGTGGLIINKNAGFGKLLEQTIKCLHSSKDAAHWSQAAIKRADDFSEQTLSHQFKTILNQTLELYDDILKQGGVNSVS